MTRISILVSSLVLSATLVACDDTAAYNDDVPTGDSDEVEDTGDSTTATDDTAVDTGIDETYEEFCANGFTVLTGASAPWERVETEVIGLPYLEYDMSVSNNIAQGDSATVRMRITALCGDIRIEGLVALVVWSDNEYD